MKSSHLRIAAACIAMTALVACSGKQAAEAPPPAAQAAPAVPVPSSSPLAKIKPGMTYQEVTNILGAPSAQMEYESGKRWIPYYYGSDARRTSYFYKGLGRVVFSAGNVFGGARAGAVEQVEYDPTETGVAR
jgi:outer membrane protein assembly factor BamE (lipoprotein component of BamABCDE complex)